MSPYPGTRKLMMSCHLEPQTTFQSQGKSYNQFFLKVSLTSPLFIQLKSLIDVEHFFLKGNLAKRLTGTAKNITIVL